MKTLLITGASGFLGWHIGQLARDRWQVYGTYKTKPFNAEGVIPVAVDLINEIALSQVFQDLKPDAVIHTAAISQPNDCQQHPQASHAINVAASWAIASLCADQAIPYAFTSSDMVFDGRNPPYREADPVSPINLYGEQKAAAEVGILERYPAAAICRMPLMFGAAPTAPSFLQPFLKKLRSGEVLHLFTDEFRTPVSGHTAAKGLMLVIENQMGGRIHLGGKERVSRYDFGRLMVDVFDIQNAKIEGCRQADVPMAAPRPPDVSMDSSYAFSLGYAPGSVKEELELIQGLV
jgi:dTDP-4-dehydrorhamnose reductase